LDRFRFLVDPVRNSGMVQSNMKEKGNISNGVEAFGVRPVLVILALMLRNRQKR